VLSISICNQGDGPLAWSLSEEPDLPWLGEEPPDGSLAPGACQAVTVTLDATGLPPGTHTGVLLLNSNDPDTPQVPLAATLTVLEAVHDAGFSWDPLQPLLGQEVTFQGVASGTQPIAFEWQFGDGLTATGITATHTYTATGAYTVTMTAGNGCGQQGVQHGLTVRSSGPTMYVGFVHLHYVDRGSGRYSMRGRVQILDGSGGFVPGATVKVDWTLPNGSVHPQQAVTNAIGEAPFKSNTRLSGTFQLCVSDVLLAGWVYDPEQNVETCISIPVP